MYIEHLKKLELKGFEPVYFLSEIQSEWGYFSKVTPFADIYSTGHVSSEKKNRRVETIGYGSVGHESDMNNFMRLNKLKFSGNPGEDCYIDAIANAIKSIDDLAKEKGITVNQEKQLGMRIKNYFYNQKRYHKEQKDILSEKGIMLSTVYLCYAK